MLCSLTIKNYVLIKELNFEPKAGLSTITGETGAGKSILLGALGLITGHRADTQTLLDKDEKCVVEAVFDITNYSLNTFFEDNDLDFESKTIIRREINPAGKSRAFINDVPVTLDILKSLGKLLIDVHSQGETQELHGKEYQVKVVDFLTDSVTLARKYSAQFSALKKFKKALEVLKANANQGSQEQEFNLFLLQELQSINLESIDFNSLESEVKSIENFGEIKTSLASLIQLIDGEEVSVNQLLGVSLQQVKTLTKLSSKYEDLEQKASDIFYNIQELIKTITHENEAMEIDEETAQLKLDQFNVLQTLLKKHRVDNVVQLIEIKEELERKTNLVANFDGEIANLENTIIAETEKLLSVGEKLHEHRLSKSGLVSKRIVSICQELGISEAEFSIDFDALVNPTNFGLYDMRLLFSANKGIALQEMSKAASGGEFSRLMFAIKSLLAEKTHLPTIIFDEIDTGISGEIALKMGALMRKMGLKHQMISITHLPQIAAKGEHHFFVYKDHSGAVSSSNIRLLSTEERTVKIAEMIAGNNPGATALQSAKELLEFEN